MLKQFARWVLKNELNAYKKTINSQEKELRALKEKRPRVCVCYPGDNTGYVIWWSDEAKKFLLSYCDSEFNVTLNVKAFCGGGS